MAMADHCCPLCKSRDSELIDVLDTSAIVKIYVARLGVRPRFSSAQLAYLRCSVCGINYFDPSESGDAELYEQLQRFDWYYMADKWEYDYAAGHVSPKDHVLEVGAGRAAFAKYVGNGRYTGLEYNDRAIQQAGRDGIRLIKQSVEDHARSSHRYDVVVSFQVVEHVSDPDGFIRACLSCLGPGGKLIVSAPAHDGFSGRAINHVLDMPPHHVTHWSKAVMEYLAVRYGLDIIGITHEPIAAYHRTWARRITVENSLRRHFGLPRRLLDVTLLARVFAFVSQLLARLLPIRIRDDLGHTITAVYRKR